MRKLKRTGASAKSRVEFFHQQAFVPRTKMSEVLLDFAEPLFAGATDDDDKYLDAAISFAVICWNCSFLPHKEREKIINAFLDELSMSDVSFRPVFRECADLLIERKQVFFKDDTRMILNYKLLQEKDGPRLLVESALAQDYSPTNSTPCS